MNCHDCDKQAVWLVIDQTGFDAYLLPLCDEHFEELKDMEGEINMDFEYFEDCLSEYQLTEIIKKVNRHNQTWEKRYENIMKELNSARKLLGLKPGQAISDLLKHSPVTTELSVDGEKH